MLLRLYHHYRGQWGNYTEHGKQLYQHYERVLVDCHDKLLVAMVHVLRKNNIINHRDKNNNYEVDLYYKPVMIQN
jgi:hypothetical protein